jgi:hypothetical protein
MTGEMSRDDVTCKAYPLHFAAAKKISGSTVEPFDMYQGPFIYVSGKGRYWLLSDDDVVGRWWSERTNEISCGFFCNCIDNAPAEAFRELVEFGGTNIDYAECAEDAHSHWRSIKRNTDDDRQRFYSAVG